MYESGPHFGGLPVRFCLRPSWAFCLGLCLVASWTTSYVRSSAADYEARGQLPALSQNGSGASPCPALPLAASYVISLNVSGLRPLRRFWKHVSGLCSLGGFTWHQGFVPSLQSLQSEQVRRLVPGLNVSLRQRWGNMGAGLAHLTLWERIARSPQCAQSPGLYVLVSEDDERPRDVLPDAISEIVRIFSSLPRSRQPGYVNLNAYAPYGKLVAMLPGAGELRLFQKQWEPCRRTTSKLLCNVWSSLYLIKCNSAQRLAETVGKYAHTERIPDFLLPKLPLWNGADPLLDQNLALVCSDPNISVRCAVVGPTEVLSAHDESVSYRQGINKKKR